MRRLAPLALALAAVLLPASLGVARLEQHSAQERTLGELRREAAEHGHRLTDAFGRSRTMLELTAMNPAVRGFDEAPGSTGAKLARTSALVDDLDVAFTTLHAVFPNEVDAASVVDRTGVEHVRTLLGQPAARRHRLPAPDHARVFALAPGQIVQSRPYRSPHTGRTVIASSTPVLSRDAAPSVVRIEVPLEAFARQALAGDGDYAISVVDARTGAPVLARGGDVIGAPAAAGYPELAGLAGREGHLRRPGRRVAVFAGVEGALEGADPWLVVVAATRPLPSLGASFGLLSLMMVGAGVVLFAFAVLGLRARALRAEARTDHLTGLANRRLLYDRVERAIETARRDGTGAALLVIDLDRFKDLNDTLGHHAGDVLLQQIGPRLRAAVRPTDLVARLGGDEFAVLLTGACDERAVLDVAERVQASLASPLPVEDLHVHVDASVGVSLYPEHAATGADLLQRADVAMYEAKARRTGIEVYAAGRDVHSRDRLALVSDLRTALEHHELVVHYQPKADVRTGRVVGAEALVRWQHPERGLVPPQDFLPLIEQTGLMHPVTLYVLDAALGRCAAWARDGLELTVAVNVTAADLLHAEFPEQVAELLARRGVEPARLVIEITETTIMSEPERVLDVLARLSELGVGLSLDDFGTGYSSLAQLKRLPVQEVKVDRSFVMHMDEDADDEAIVRSTVELAHNLGLRVVAEGVETEAIRARLAALGCDLAQGFLLSPPLPADRFGAWLAASAQRAGRA